MSHFITKAEFDRLFKVFEAQYAEQMRRFAGSSRFSFVIGELKEGDKIHQVYRSNDPKGKQILEVNRNLIPLRGGVLDKPTDSLFCPPEAVQAVVEKHCAGYTHQTVVLSWNWSGFKFMHPHDHRSAGYAPGTANCWTFPVTLEGADLSENRFYVGGSQIKLEERCSLVFDSMKIHHVNHTATPVIWYVYDGVEFKDTSPLKKHPVSEIAVVRF